MNKKIITLIGCLVLSSQYFMSLAQAESVTLNLKGADINAVIGTVADITNKNFIVDPRVKGQVTIISSRPMNEKEIYQVFLSVLEVHGFTAVPIGKIIKILPDADAKHSAIPALPENKTGRGDEAVTRVIEIEHVTAAQLVPILRPLVPPQGHLAAYPASNMLIISDRAANINRLVEIIDRIDQPTSGEIEFVQLEHAAAVDVVRVLNNLQQQNKKNAKSQIPILVADDRSNSILIGGEKAKRLQLRAIIAHLDTPSETTGDTHVVYLRYAKAVDLVPVLTGVQQTREKVGTTKVKGQKAIPRATKSTQQGLFNIQADESSNALVITAPLGVFRSLQDVIRKLDIRRAQVLVEAVVAEVSLNTTGKLGVEWLGVDRDPSGTTRPAIATNFGNGLTDALATLPSGSTALPSIGRGVTFGIGKIVKDGFSFGGLINALKTDGATNILSTPNLVTLDNQEAEIFVGQEVSIPSGSFTSTTNDSTNPFTTFNREKVGLTLKVKPQISEGNTVKLEIDQSIEDIIAGQAGEGDLQTSERSIKTTVIVDDGSVLVLGGLIKDDVIETESKVPLLGDIPVLGALFRSKASQKTKTNLMIFLKTVILRDAKNGLNLTQNKYDYIREKQLELRSQGISFIADDEIPVLKAFDELLELPPPFEDTTDKVLPKSSVEEPAVTSNTTDSKHATPAVDSSAEESL